LNRSMLVKVFSSIIMGVEAVPVSIEVHITQGIRFFIVGLADGSIRESQQRIESALVNNRYAWPRYRVVINLAPADIRKDGTHFDLPLAIGILAASGQLCIEPLEDYMVMGELSLDGSVQPVKGVLPMAILARKKGFKGIIVPRGNALEAAMVEGLKVVSVKGIREAVQFLEGGPVPGPASRGPAGPESGTGTEIDYLEVAGQQQVKRAMLIAAAGRHNVLLIGPPGSGKSMMARRLTTILPPMTLEESLETTSVYSVAGKTDAREGLLRERPFRAPHHSASDIAMIGGGGTPRPGEISLAHNGILFLDELPEFRRHVLEVLRQPLEDRRIHIARASYRVTYPADFMLVAAMNPCPCGYYNHPSKTCVCGPGTIRNYLSRISGPLLDRIDLHVEVAPVPYEQFTSGESSGDSCSMRDSVAAAMEIQTRRFKGSLAQMTNARMGPALRRKHCRLNVKGKEVIGKAGERLGLSARAFDRILKVARTIADLEGSMRIQPRHVSEAISYRNLDRENWSGQGSVQVPSPSP